MRSVINKIPFVFILLMTYPTFGQVRFYLQYEGIPMYEGGSWDFNVLSGIKVSPDKEVMVGLGLVGHFTPKDLNGDIKFNKSSLSLGFNYYQSRKLYFTFNVTANLLRDIIKAPTQDYDDFVNNFLLDYQIYINYIVLRRLHFSFGTGVIDFTDLVIDTAHNIITGNFVQPNISLALKLYVFQIKF